MPQRPRRELSAAAEADARRMVDLAWADLPRHHRALLESIGAAGRDVVNRPLGEHVRDLAAPAGLGPLSATERGRLNLALAVWVEPLRVVLIDAGHPEFRGLDQATYERVLARIAWHEWAHALSVVRTSDEDVRRGSELLDLAPPGVARIIRSSGYGPREYTHELVAEIYAILMVRRRSGHEGRPSWLNEEIYRVVAMVTGWND